MNPTLKILHVVWNLIRGGTEGQCARMAMELARRKHVSRVAVFRHEGFFLESVERECGPVLDIGIRRMLSLETLARILRLKDFIRHGQFDLVHCWDADANIFGSLAGRLAGVPYITSRRDLGQIYPPRKLWLMRRADAGAAAIVVNAESIRERLRAAGVPARKIEVVPNLFDLAEFDEQTSAPFSLDGNLPPGRLVGHVARLDREKDVATFVRAAAIVTARVPNVYFVVAGHGPERRALEKLADQLAASSRVLFLGEVTDVPALLKRVSVSVLVSKSNEGLSNSILEYMAAGLPVVATDCGGNRELVVEGGNGFIVPAGDAETLAAAIERLLADPELAGRFGRAGRNRVAQNHSSEQVVEKMLTVYSKRML